MNQYLESVSDFLTSIQMWGERNSCDPDFFLISLLDEDGVIERFQWLGLGHLNTKVGGCDELISTMIERLKRHNDLIDCATFVGPDGDIRNIIVECVRDRLRLVVFGAGHVGRAVARLGALLGYRVILVDDRQKLLSCTSLSGAGIQTLQVDFGGELSHVGISHETAIVIVTRGHQYDEVCLKYSLSSPAFYVGMIGSRRRVLSIFRRLEMEGFEAGRLKSVFAPIGLRIGAVSPQEIAVSIMAEIISCTKGGGLEGECHLKV